MYVLGRDVEERLPHSVAAIPDSHSDRSTGPHSADLRKYGMKCLMIVGRDRKAFRLMNVQAGELTGSIVPTEITPTYLGTGLHKLIRQLLNRISVPSNYGHAVAFLCEFAAMSNVRSGQ